MQGAVPLVRNPKGMYVQLLIFTIGAFVCGFLLSWLFQELLGWTEGGGAVAETIGWLFIVVTWAIASLRLWVDWYAKHYEVSDDALIVHTRAGKLGRSRTIYRYDSIISMRMTQGFLGKRYGYGDVHITIPKIEGDVVMNDIADPDQQLSVLQQRLGEHTDVSTAALVV